MYLYGAHREPFTRLLLLTRAATPVMIMGFPPRAYAARAVPPGQGGVPRDRARYARKVPAGKTYVGSSS